MDPGSILYVNLRPVPRFSGGSKYSVTPEVLFSNYNLAQIAHTRFLVYVMETFKTKKKKMEMLSIPLFALLYHQTLLYSPNKYNVTLRCEQ